MTPGTTIPEGSPSLDQPLRSRHEAALDIAVKALDTIWRKYQDPSWREARRALDKIADLVPEAVKP